MGCPRCNVTEEFTTFMYNEGGLELFVCLICNFRWYSNHYEQGELMEGELK